MQTGGKWNPRLLSVEFNQDASHVTLGTPRGMVVLAAASGARIFECRAVGPVAVCEMYYGSSLFAVAGHARRPAPDVSLEGATTVTAVAAPEDDFGAEPSSAAPVSATATASAATAGAPLSAHRTGPRTVAMMKGGSLLAELNFVTCVLGVRLSTRRMAVVLETRIHLFDVEDLAMARLHCLDTHPNPRALCALAVAGEGCIMAYPSSAAVGEVAIFDALRLVPLPAIRAHSGPIAALALSRDGTLLATASSKGTVIRVFVVATGAKLCSFRRGRNVADVFSLAFNSDARILAATSDTGTLHLFQVPSTAAVAKLATVSGACPATGVCASQPLMATPAPVTATTTAATTTTAPSVTTSSGGSTAAHYNFFQLPAGVSEALFENVRSFASMKIACSVTTTTADGSVKYPPSLCAFDADNRLLIATADGFLHQYLLGPKNDLRHSKTFPLTD